MFGPEVDPDNADWRFFSPFQLRTNRTGQATAVLGAVRARHNELQKIEQQIIELGAMFQDLDTLVIQQEAVVMQAEQGTEETNTHLVKGNEQVGVANEHARRRRKLKWYCLLVVVLIIIALVLGLVLGFVLPAQAAKKATGQQ